MASGAALRRQVDHPFRPDLARGAHEAEAIRALRRENLASCQGGVLEVRANSGRGLPTTR